MDGIASALFAGMVGVIGTGAGGALALLTGNKSNRAHALMLHFTAGLMIAVVCFDLLPSAFGVGGVYVGLFGVILGVAAMMLLGRWQHRRPKLPRTQEQSRWLGTGILLMLGIMGHNLPEGLAIGAGYQLDPQYGLTIAILIGIHDLPEGLAMGLPLMLGGVKRYRVVLYALIAGIPTVIGALIGAALGSLSNEFISICLGFAGGSMLFVTCNDLIPESSRLHRSASSGLAFVLGVTAAVLLIAWM